jgi:hypothetical protein
MGQIIGQTSSKFDLMNICRSSRAECPCRC